MLLLLWVPEPWYSSSNFFLLSWCLLLPKVSLSLTDPPVVSHCYCYCILVRLVLESEWVRCMYLIFWFSLSVRQGLYTWILRMRTSQLFLPSSKCNDRLNKYSFPSFKGEPCSSPCSLTLFVVGFLQCCQSVVVMLPSSYILRHFLSYHLLWCLMAYFPS